MSNPSLVVVAFGDCHVNFRRHWGGDPVIVGSEMLDLLASAETIKPRQDFHTGSYLLRLMFSDVDGTSGLPTYEAYVTNDGVYSDWEFAYRFECEGEDSWRIGYVPSCDGEPWCEIAEMARWFSPVEFREFVERKFAEDHAQGNTYDVVVRDAFLNQLGRSSKDS